MFTYQEARLYIIENFLKDMECHLDMNFKDIGKGFEYYDTNLVRNNEPEYNPKYELEFQSLYIALNFWDAWQDARNHNWKYYDEINQEDWPKLASLLIDNIQNSSKVTDTVLLKYFKI